MFLDLDIDMGMDMDYYDLFVVFFGGGDGGFVIFQWVIDMLGIVYDFLLFLVKYYFRY